MPIKRKANPLKLDPTRTVTIRRNLCAQMRARFASVRKELRKMFVEEDTFGLKNPIVNTTYQFTTDPQKLRLFKLWLKRQIDVSITPPDKLWERYAEIGWKKGASRAFDDVKKYGTGQKPDFYNGTRDEFLRSAFNQPVAIEKIQILAQRSFDDLENVTGDMSTRMTRTLADGMARGDSPRDIADRMSDDMDISEERALTIARTEIIRAHAEGQLDAMDKMGVEEVGVAVEWSTTGDDKVCPKCSDLEGIVLKLDEARGKLPRHPNCRCAWIPANVGEDDSEQKDTKKEIDEALEEAGVDDTVSQDRPQSIVSNLELIQKPRLLTLLDRFLITNGWYNDDPQPSRAEFELLYNAFCPTGVGGGVNPHCSPGTHGIPISHSLTKVHKGISYTVTATATGFNVTHTPPGSTTPSTTHYNSITAAATGVMGKTGSGGGWKFFGATNPKLAAKMAATSSTTPTTPGQSTPAAPLTSTIPFAPETNWKTGEPQQGQVLNGVPFAAAPPKFWEKTKDVDIKEPKPLSKIDRVGVMIKEPDGRIWIVQPTNEFGNRKYTIPGGGVEKGLTDQQNALKETWEETGLQIRITGHLGDFKDSNNGNNGRLYIGERIGGAPWDAKIESHITDNKTGKPAAESSAITLVTPERAAQLLHRTDDLAQLATVAPIPIKTSVNGQMMDKLVRGMQPAAKAYEDPIKRAGQKPGNPILHTAQELRGFNGKPKVVSKSEMDALITKDGHIEMLRGVKDFGYGSSKLTAKEMVEAFKNGQHFPGHGVFGSGTYADSNPGSNNAAGTYGAGGSTMRMALPKDAKIIKVSDLEKLVPSNPSAFHGYANGNGSSEECWMGVHATLAGYDAIHVDGKSSRHGSYGNGFYVILNRSILTVQSSDARGHVIK